MKRLSFAISVLTGSSLCGSTASALPPPVQPSFCTATMCLRAGVIPEGGRTISPTFSDKSSRGLGEIGIAYEDLGAVSLLLEEVPREECGRAPTPTAIGGSARYSFTRFIAIAKPFARYRGPQCRRITVSIDGVTADAAGQMHRRLYTLWLLAGRNLHFVDNRNILTPYDARVDFSR